MKPLLVFDMDGTLVDSAKDIAESLNLTLKKYGKNPIAHDIIVAHIGDGLKKLLQDFFPEHTHDFQKQIELENEFLTRYEEVMFQQTTIFPGVESFLEKYEGPIGIITNKNEAPAKTLLSHLKLDRFQWVEVFGADSLAEKKPSPLPLQTMMRLAQYSPNQTIMIGDGRPDIISAREAGCGALAIGFGYTDVNILQSLGAHQVLAHYDHLDHIVNHWVF